MERDLDEKLYSDYLNGKKEAFEFLYNKYNKRIEYFVFNIIKDYQKAEDIAQETFIYVMQNKMREKSSFKYYIYMIAKSRAINHINTEERREKIIKEYCCSDLEKTEKDVLEFIAKEETRKEVLEAIELLNEKYKNAIYLVSIEGLSYEETAKILGQTLQNTKNLIHRGKVELRKILLKKGFDEMNKVSKVLIIIACATVLLGGIVYATTVIYNNYIKNNTNHNITMNATYQSELDENTANNLWVGTLDLAWKELKEKIGVDTIELEDGNLPIVDNLNSSKFSKEMLNSNNYEINVERTFTNGYKIDSTLNKELNFLEIFDNFSIDYTSWNFGSSEEYIKYFGINNASSEEMNKNIEVLFYKKNSETDLRSNDCAVKLKTKEGDEIILYRTDSKKSLEEYYTDIETKTKNYTGNRTFSEKDELRVPYVRVNGMISYKELNGRDIKDTNGLYIAEVIQNVNFSLNEKGCNLSSKATMVVEYMSASMETKYCYFNDTFIIFMKEANSNNPYFALKVDNSDILEKIEETDEPKLIDYTMTAEKDKYTAEQRRI